MREQAGFLKHVADRPLVRLAKGRFVLPDLAIDRAKASGQVMQASQTACDGGLAAAGSTEYRRHASRRGDEAGVERKVSEAAAQCGLNFSGFNRGPFRGHERPPALRFSINVIIRIPAKANITMPPARMLASRQRDA